MKSASISVTMTARLKPCCQCGDRPSELEPEKQPRKVEIFSFGRLWKVEVVCGSCLAIYRGASLPEALNKWQAKIWTGKHYEPETTAEDLRSAHEAWLRSGCVGPSPKGGRA